MLAEYTAAVLADDPEFYWQCQDAALPLTDSSGNSFPSNGSTQAGDISFQLAGPCGDDFAIRFAGGFANANAARNAVPLTSVNNFTLEWWVYYISGNASTFTIGDFFNNGYYWGFFPGGATRISVAGVAHLASFANTPPTNAWCHLVAVRRAGTWEYYFDGAVDTANVSSALPVAPTTQTLIGYIGSAMVYRAAHLAAYDTALTAERIAAHFAAASEPPPPTPGSGGNAHRLYLQGDPGDDPDPRVILSPGTSGGRILIGGE